MLLLRIYDFIFVTYCNTELTTLLTFSIFSTMKKILLFSLAIICTLTYYSCYPDDINTTIDPHITSTSPTSIEEFAFEDAPKYPYYTGQCKLILKAAAENGCGNPCSNYNIEILGYSGIWGSGQLLFTINSTLSSVNWTVYDIPESAYLTFTISGCSSGNYCSDGIERIQLYKAKFGFQTEGVFRNIPVGSQYLNHTAENLFLKYPPYNQDNTQGHQYTCAEWCTWEAEYTIGSTPDGWGSYLLWMIPADGGPVLCGYQQNPQNSNLSRLYYPIAKRQNYITHSEWTFSNQPAPICTNISSDGVTYVNGLPTIGASPILSASRFGCGILHEQFQTCQ